VDNEEQRAERCAATRPVFKASWFQQSAALARDIARPRATLAQIDSRGEDRHTATASAHSRQQSAASSKEYRVRSGGAARASGIANDAGRRRCEARAQQAQRELGGKIARGDSQPLFSKEQSEQFHS
jgi:hypothetical protein